MASAVRPGIEADHHPGREVAAEGGGAVEDDGGPVFFGQLGQRLLIGAGAVFFKVFMLRRDDRVRAAGEELLREGGDAAAEKHGGDLLAAVRRKLARLGEKLEDGGLDVPVLLFCKYPNAFVIVCCHV